MLLTVVRKAFDLLKPCRLARASVCGLVVLIGCSGVPSIEGSATTRPVVGAATRRVPESLPEAAGLLRTVYRLRDGEDLRVIRPPFPPEREDYAHWSTRNTFGEPRAVLNMFFLQRSSEGPNGAWGSWIDGPTYPEQLLAWAVDLRWWEIGDMGAMNWSPGSIDVVVRDGAGRERKIAALAEVIRRDTGRNIVFVKRTVTRTCVVVRGKTKSDVPKVQTIFPRAVLATERPTDAEIAEWTKLQRVPGGHAGYSLPVESRFLGAPVMFEADAKGEVDSNFHYVLVAPGLDLKPEDPQFRQKLGRAVEYLRQQLGGDWTIEDRAVEVWSAEVRGR